MFYKKKEKTKAKEYSMIGKTKSSLRILLISRGRF